MTEAKFAANVKVASSRIGDEMALMNLQNNKYFTLNQVGAVIWEEIGTPKALSELCAVVESRFEVSHSTCKDDIVELLEQLKDAGLVEEQI